MIIVDLLVGPSGSRTVSDNRDGVVDQPAIESLATRKRKVASTGSSDK